jgi:hypothetical protein
VHVFRTRVPDLQVLIQYRYRTIICLQETHPRPSYASYLRGYTAYRLRPPKRRGGQWRDGVRVKDCMHCARFSLRSMLEFAGLCTYSVCYGFCNMHFSPAVPPTDPRNLISKLPLPFIVHGDFNAKNILWDAVLSDGRRRSDYGVCAAFDSNFLNTSAHTPLPGVRKLAYPEYCLLYSGVA